MSAPGRRLAASWAGAALLFAALVLAQAVEPAAVAGAHERGRIPVVGFAPRDYGAAAQNWALAQDERGVLYVGNTDGVLEYDGVAWRLIATARGTGVRSLAKGDDGRIYVGGQAEFGYLAADELGGSRFVSLSDRLKPEEAGFSDVWWTFASADGIYFQTQQRLFRFAAGELRSWAPPLEGVFLRSFLVGRRLLVSHSKLGLLELVDNALQPLPDAEALLGKRLIFAMPLRNAEGAERILVVTDRSGWFRHDGERFHPYPIPADAELAQLPIYTGRALSGERLALNTLGAGVLVLDRHGQPLARVGRAEGLRSEQVLASLEDREGNLWLGLGNGIAHVSAFSPLSHFGEESGVRGLISSVRRHRGRLYAAGTEGLLVLHHDPARFERHPAAFVGPVWSLLSLPDGLLVGHNGGVRWLSPEGDQVAIQNDAPAMALLHDRNDPDRVWVGGMVGPVGLHRIDGVWSHRGLLVRTQSFIRSLAQDAQGRIWAGSEQDGVLRIDPLPPGPLQGPLDEALVQRLGPEQGLTSNNRTQVFAAAGEILVFNEGRLFRFDEDKSRLREDERFLAMLGHPETRVALHPILAQDAAGRLWTTSHDAERDRHLGVAVDDGQGGLEWHYRELRPLRPREFYAVHPEPDGVVWIATDEGLARFDPNQPRDYGAAFSALIRAATRDGEPIALAQGGGHPTLSFSPTALRFDYAATSSIQPGALRYQTLLEGQDADWSAWTDATYREYTNLREGSYRFRVRARNAFDAIGAEDSFAFAVAPPWFRAPWALALWAVLALAAVWALLRWRLHRLRQETRRLEAQVAERTRDLAERSSQLETLIAIVQSINRQTDLDHLLATLLLQIRGVIHGAQVASALLPDEGANRDFTIRASTDPAPPPDFRLSPAEAQARYVDAAETIAEDVFLIRDTAGLAANERLTADTRAQSLLVLRVGPPEGPQAYMVLANRERADAFDQHDLDLLVGLREHLRSAHAKFRSIAALERARDAAERAARFKGDFLANISHEIRTPMNAIIGFSRLGEDVAELERAHDYLRKIGTAGETLIALVNDVLDLSKIEAGRLELERAHFDLTADLRHLRELFEHRAQEKGIRLWMDLSDDLPRYVLGDSLRLRQVLINLVGNAIKFTERGHVRVRVWRSRPAAEGLWLAFSVEDSGIGIRPEAIDSLFEAFGQAEAGTARHYGGTGLGLSISRRLVRLMDGDIEVRSQPGHGSEFLFRIRLEPGDPAQVAQPQRFDAGSLRSLRGLRVLLVEDNRINQEVASRILARAGMRVEVAGNGQTAIDKAAYSRFDAVLMDVHMPGLDGYETTARLRAMPGLERLPIIALTAHAVSGYRERCLDAGMNDYLTKPFEPETLYQTLIHWTRGEDEPEPEPATGGEADAAADFRLEGFDTVAALRRVGGDLAFYRRLLDEFCEDFDDVHHRLRELTASGQSQQARRLMHAFKGVAAILGGNALADSATALERALGEETAAVPARLAAFEQGFTAALDAIRALQPAPVEAAPSLSEEDVARAWDELQSGLERSDPTCEAIWDALRPTIDPVYVALIERFDGELRAFAFGDALVSFARLRAVAQPGG